MLGQPTSSGPVLGAFRSPPPQQNGANDNSSLTFVPCQMTSILFHLSLICTTFLRDFFSFSDVFGVRKLQVGGALLDDPAVAIYTQPSSAPVFSSPLPVRLFPPVDIKERECNRCPHTLLPSVSRRSLNSNFSLLPLARIIISYWLPSNSVNKLCRLLD